MLVPPPFVCEPDASNRKACDQARECPSSGKIAQSDAGEDQAQNAWDDECECSKAGHMHASFGVVDVPHVIGAHPADIGSDPLSIAVVLDVCEQWIRLEELVAHIVPPDDRRVAGLFDMCVRKT